MRHYPPPPSKYIIKEYNNEFSIKKRVKKIIKKPASFLCYASETITYNYEFVLNENETIKGLGLLENQIKKFNTFEEAKKYIDEVLKKIPNITLGIFLSFNTKN